MADGDWRVAGTGLRGFPWTIRRFEGCKTFTRLAKFGVSGPSFCEITIDITPSIVQIVVRMKRNPKGVRFRDLCRVCDFYFGAPRRASGSHRVYRTPWQGNPRINIQDDHGEAKAYQVRQVLAAIELLGEIHEQG